VNFQRCRTCGQLQPQREPHFSQYGGLKTRLRWKQACNACIDKAHGKRVRKPTAQPKDHRDYRHPLEEVIWKWRSIASLEGQ